MDEYLSEKEQIERIREWWRDNGWYLVGGIALGALALFGWREYQRYIDARGVQAEALYGQVRDAVGGNDRDTAAKLVAQLRDKYGSSPYTDQAGLILARSYLVTDTSKAADELRYVMEHTRDGEIGIIARLRLARVLVYQKKEQEALNLLAVDDPGQFAAQIDEIRGDAYVALGEADAARTAYSSALAAPGADWVNRNFLEMKLASLGAAEQTPANAGAGAAPAANAGAEAGPAGGAPPASGAAAEAGDGGSGSSGAAAGADPGVAEPAATTPSTGSAEPQAGAGK